jgi:hypothetical protein
MARRKKPRDGAVVVAAPAADLAIPRITRSELSEDELLNRIKAGCNREIRRKKQPLFFEHKGSLSKSEILQRAARAKRRRMEDTDLDAWLLELVRARKLHVTNRRFWV